MRNYPRLFVWLVIIFLIVVVVAYYLYRKNKTTATTQKSIDGISVDKTSLTITDSQATVIAENLLGAMNRYGTDEQTIINNLKTLKKDDILLVMKKFGVRPYNGNALATRSYEKQFFSTDLDLIGWLKEELDGEDLNEVSNIFLNAQIPF